MNDNYIDSDGIIVICIQLTGPTLLNTINGEVCANEGDWLINLNDGKIAILNDDSFKLSFKKLEE